MSEQSRAGVVGGARHRADVRQALLKSGFDHLYPGIPPVSGIPLPLWPIWLWLHPVAAASDIRGPRSRPRRAAFPVSRASLRGEPGRSRRSRLEDRRQRRADAR